VNSLSLGDEAELASGLTYVSFSELNRTPNSNIVGELVRRDPVYEEANSSVADVLMVILTVLFAVLSWYLLARTSLNQIVEGAMANSVKPVLIGLGWFVLVPVVIGVLLISMIGSLVGVALLFAYLLTIMLTIASLPAVLGQLLMKVFTKMPGKLNLLTILIGVLVLLLLTRLPMLGTLLIFILFLVSMGSLVEYYRSSKKA
jgi:hypothetical protein